MKTARSPGTAWGSIVIDFQGVAGLIDTVLENAPERLEALLKILWSSNEWLETRVVLEIVVRCRDPLAPLASLCRDGLKATADLETLQKRQDVAAICPPGHANAILNLCDAALRKPSPHTAKRRAHIRRIRPQVKIAAVAEMNRIGGGMTWNVSGLRVKPRCRTSGRSWRHMHRMMRTIREPSAIPEFPSRFLCRIRVLPARGLLALVRSPICK